MSAQTISEEESVMRNVVEQVATVRDQEVTQLPPLYKTIDGEALNSLINSIGTGSSLEIQFSYAGQRVIIDERGAVRVETS